MEDVPENNLQEDIYFALECEMCEGFGFQVSRERKCLYIAQVFVWPTPDFRSNNPHEMPESALALVHDFVPPDKIWLTDFCGYEWVTISVDHFNDIERVLNTFLVNGYRVLTHTQPKAEFKPGERFSRQTLDSHLMDTFRVNYNLASEMGRGQEAAFSFVKDFVHVRRLWRYQNWATQEGRDFCKWLREAYHKPVAYRPDKQTRFSNPRFLRGCQEAGILFAGGWYTYVPFTTHMAAAVLVEHVQEEIRVADEQIDQEQGPLKRVATEITQESQIHEEEEAEEEDSEKECMICYERVADTLVLPCEHRVVCGECSRNLRRTNDNRTCVQCRRPISHVAYADNEFEVK